jgi:hypothetical protein
MRQGEPGEMTTRVGDSPIAGGGTRTTQEESVKVRVRPWTWGDAVWHYDDGSSVVYPAYESLDWEKQ